MSLNFYFILCFCLFIRLYSTADLRDQYIGCYKDNETSLGDGTSITSMTISSCIEYCRGKQNTYAGTQNGNRCYCGDTYGKYGFSSECNVICKGNSSYFCGGALHNSIYAVCPISLYGPSCGKECHCKNRMPCNIKNGSCPNGCADGWTGKDCNTTTASGRLSYQGCYRNSIAYLPFIWTSEKRQHFIQNRNYFMTIQWCMDECRAKYPLTSYLFAGLQFAYQCTCGYSNYTDTGTSNKCGSGCQNDSCNCSGNSSQRCGGEHANDVYSACQFGYFGPACSQQCHCANDGNCSMETGDCGSPGCAKGWKGTACNIRECNEVNGDCQGVQEVCVKENLGPGKQPVDVTRCRCKKGYNRKMEHENCTDINECTIGYPDNECNPLFGNCSNQEGSYTCNCYSGFLSKSATLCKENGHDSNIPLIVALGGELLIIIVIAIICYKRQKNAEVYKRNEEADTRQQASQSPNESESVYTDLDLSTNAHVTERERVYTDLIQSNNAQVTDARDDNSSTQSYDYVA